MNGGAIPDSRATAINLVVNATGLGIALQSNSQTAPPDHTSPDTGTIAAGTATGLFDLALLNTSVQARTEAAVACIPAGGPIAKSEVQTAGAIVNPNGVGTIVDTGDATVNGTVAIFPEPLSDPLNRALVSTATGTITTNTFLNGQVSLSISGPSTLQAFASGEPGGADTSYSPGTVTVTVGSVTTPLGLGASQTFNGSNGSVVITVNQPTVTESADGRTATATVAVVTAQVTVTSGTDDHWRRQPWICCHCGPQPLRPTVASTAHLRRRY